MSVSDDTLMVLDQIEAHTHIPKKTLYLMRSEGRGPRMFKLGRKLVARASDVNAWIAEQERLSGRGGTAAGSAA